MSSRAPRRLCSAKTRYCFSSGYGSGIPRQLVVLKLWQVMDPFSPDAFLDRLSGGSYDWDDLRRLVRPAEHMEPSEILATVERPHASLRGLTELEQQVIVDAKGDWNRALSERLKAEIRVCFAGPSRG